jgi:hypothetical protein
MGVLRHEPPRQMRTARIQALAAKNAWNVRNRIGSTPIGVRGGTRFARFIPANATFSSVSQSGSHPGGRRFESAWLHYELPAQPQFPPLGELLGELGVLRQRLEAGTSCPNSGTVASTARLRLPHLAQEMRRRRVPCQGPSTPGKGKGRERSKRSFSRIDLALQAAQHAMHPTCSEPVIFGFLRPGRGLGRAMWSSVSS